MRETLRKRGRQLKNTVQEANEKDEQSIQTNNASSEDEEENSEWDE